MKPSREKEWDGGNANVGFRELGCLLQCGRRKRNEGRERERDVMKRITRQDPVSQSMGGVGVGGGCWQASKGSGG